MNSEDTFRFKQIVTPQQLYAEAERDKQNKSDAKTTAEGETIVAFISHPGWILMLQSWLFRMISSSERANEAKNVKQNVTMSIRTLWR